jgi:hypothetical protein
MDIDSDECGGDIPSLQEGQALSLTINSTGCLSADTNAEMTHRPILPCLRRRWSWSDGTWSTYTKTANSLVADTTPSSKKQYSTQLYRSTQTKGQ